MGNPIVHWEFWSRNATGLSDFYQKVFDWKVNHVPEMNYNVVETGGEGGINGGIFTPQEGEWPGNMSLYIAVDDLDTYAEKVKGAGGRMVVEKMEVPGMGAFSLFADPDGRVIGMWQMKQG